MTTAYGSCIEPEGCDLFEEYRQHQCPQCGQPAHAWFTEHAESGSINLYTGLSCTSCGYRQGGYPSEQVD